MATTKYTQVINRLRNQMLEKKIGMTDLSNLTGRDISMVSRWINNKVQMTIPSLLLICEVMEIDPVVLFKEEPKPKRKA